MSECDSSTEETVNAIIAQFKHRALKEQFKSHQKSRQNVNSEELEMMHKKAHKRKKQPSRKIEQFKPTPNTSKGKRIRRSNLQKELLKKGLNRNDLSPEEFERLRKQADTERKRRCREKMTAEGRKQFLERKNERKRRQRLKPEFDAHRAKEAKRKRGKRISMTTEEGIAFRAKDAERKRLARLKKKIQGSFGDKKFLVKLNSARETFSSKRNINRSTLCEKTVKPKRGRPSKKPNSDESCDFEKMIHNYDRYERVKDLEAVLKDLLEEQDVKQIPENIISCELSTENRMKELEEKIWELIDKQEMAEQVDKNTKVQSDTNYKIVDSSDEFSEFENEIVKILQNQWEDDSETDTKK